MERIIEKVNDGRVEMEYTSDDISAHYFLSAEVFRVENEVLKLITQYDGACTEDYTQHSIQLNCDFNCLQCSKSIYHLVRNKERFFKKKCADLCARFPKPGDEWEISLVGKDGVYPKYRNYFFRCNDFVSNRRIIELIYDVMTERYTRGYARTDLCYIKIRRFDMPKALDCSLIGNQYMQTFIKGGKFNDVVIDMDL